MNSLIDFLKKEDVKQFIKDNVGTDVNQLILNPPSAFKENIKDIAAQILARQKAKGKLDEWATNFDLIMPPPLSIEQASSSLTCAYKKSLVSGGHLIDLTGGMGIDFLALSESYAKSTYLEAESDLCEVFKYNSAVLSKDVEVVNAEACSFLESLDSEEKPFIYLDPARRNIEKNKVFRIEDCSPNLIELLPLLREKAKAVLVKYSPLLDIQSILNSVPNIEKVHVVSVKNDCKELLLEINFSYAGEPIITCVNLASGHSPYDFKISEERNAISAFGEVGEYIVEPNSAIMKAGSFKKIGKDFELKKIGENTHLYTTNKDVENFPGRVFRVLEPADKKNLKKYASEGKINVISRNHPLNANELKKKWRLKDGGDYFLIAFRDKDEKARMFISERIGL